MKVKRSVIASVVFGALVVAAILLLWPVRRLTPAEQVKRQVVVAVRAAESKDLSTLMDQVSPSFRGVDGLDRDELRRTLAGVLLSQQWLRVFLVQCTTVPANGGVDVDAKIIFGNSKAKDLRELAATSALRAYDITAHYVNEGDDGWRAVSASIQPLEPKSLLSLTP